jgi:hypothetical protein
MTTMVSEMFEGMKVSGSVNVKTDMLCAQMASAMRRGHPQVNPQPPQAERVCLVGGGPSLPDTEGELVQLVHDGAKVVTVNGAYKWCLSRNIRPSAQIVLDARPINARFVDPVVPRCHYLLASQCHPDTWDRVDGREHVWIWHAISPADRDGVRCAEQELLDAYYLKRWQGIAGGTTVMMRALLLLRILGYLRIDLFGCDSCFMDGQHHAYSQPENDSDKRLQVMVTPTDRPEQARVFTVAPWMIQQADDFLATIRGNGKHFLLNVHGDGLLAYLLRMCAAGVAMTELAESTAA